ncbi:MAG TPA: DUF4190 domain-containing protein [Mycobacteriales bacterium]|nr:DUF4190 domain-containing protein [Mycobacteriales bacterium]
MTQPLDPYLSPDGQWRWDGTQWVPAAPVLYPPQPLYGAPPAPSQHDGKAIASLVCALVGGCGIGSIAAVVLGHQSRREARQAHREPSGLALAGVIIGYVGIAALVVVAAVFMIGASVSGGFVESVQIHGEELSVSGPVAVTLHSAGNAQAAYHEANGTYASSVSGLREFGYRPEPGVTVDVVLARADEYCLRGLDERTTYYLSTTEDVVTPSPCG